jgi:hypothetical protein
MFYNVQVINSLWSQNDCRWIRHNHETQENRGTQKEHGSRVQGAEWKDRRDERRLKASAQTIKIVENNKEK